MRAIGSAIAGRRAISVDAGWPFPDPPDAEVISLGRIVRGESPLRLVTHDEDDASWQFLDGEHVFEEDATVLHLAEMLQVDASIRELADLPVGWYAWRDTLLDPWQRAPGEPPEG